MADNDPPASNAGMEPRLAVLEQIARDTAVTLADIRADIREIRSRQDRDFTALLGRQDRDFRWLTGLYLAGTGALLGVLAHGFHWI